MATNYLYETITGLPSRPSRPFTPSLPGGPAGPVTGGARGGSSHSHSQIGPALSAEHSSDFID